MHMTSPGICLPALEPVLKQRYAVIEAVKKIAYKVCLKQWVDVKSVSSNGWMLPDSVQLFSSISYFKRSLLYHFEEHVSH